MEKKQFYIYFFILQIISISFSQASSSTYTEQTEYISISLTATHTRICVGDSVKLSAQVHNGTPPYTYIWNDELTTDSTICIAPETTQKYTVTVFDSDQQRSKTSIIIEVAEYPAADFTYTMEPNDFTVTFTNTSIDNITHESISVDYYWQFKTNNEKIFQSGNEKELPIEYTYHNLTNYRVTLWARNNFGCTDSTAKTISIYDIPYLEVPSAFSPNNDNHNDVLRAVGRNVENVEFIIYNRWGTAIFTSDKLQYGWDGTYKGNNMPTGVYPYSIKATASYAKEHIHKTGNINLIR
ncbi:MAG: gliding motility-associated C-terminal domain-containing protein [Bacteroidales bacterium]